jgi:GNAT superfamily N-acetyltransferase
MSEIMLSRHTGDGALKLLGDLAALYDQVHSERPGDLDPLFSHENFMARTTSQARQEGFVLITARQGILLAGFSFGYPFGRGTWWSDCTPPRQDILGATKFAVIELNVRNEYRGHGLGKNLLNELIADRPEAYATLAAVPGSTAHAMYLRWGWYKAGFFTTPPAMDAMVVPLAT